MRSMTGIGVGMARGDGCTVRVEIRSVNHRFLDLVFRLPAGLSEEEAKIRERLSSQIDRGRVSVSVDIERGSRASTLVVDDDFVAAYTDRARKLAAKHNLDGQLDVQHILSLPEAVCVQQAELPEALLRELLHTALDKALQKFQTMRQREGKALAKEMLSRIKIIDREKKAIAKRAASVPAEIRRRLQDRLRKMGAADAVDPNRFAAEVAIMADKASISEEIERLGSHVDQYRQAVKDGGPVAKRLGFLLQEMHREVNTTGSKSTQLSITNSVLRMKEELESMREQIQNLE